MKRQLLAFFALATLGTGCFPESLDYEPNVFLRLPLSDMGISPTQDQIDRWRTLQQAQHETFPLGTQGLDFYLGLVLDCVGQNASLQGINQFVKIEDDNGQQYLNIDLYTSECSQGVFKIALYWLNQENGLEFFSGASPSLPLPTLDPVTVDVYKHPTATVVCDHAPVGEPGEYQFAALDYEENVRLPPVITTAEGTTVSFELKELPVGRTLVIQKFHATAGAGGVWEDATGNLFLTIAGEVADICNALL